jgi:hypothetical protein
MKRFSMNFEHGRAYLQAGSIVVVNCDTQCNARVMDDANFRSYSNGQAYRALGGGYRYFPVRIPVPSSGYWNVTIDLGGSPDRFRYSMNYIGPG